MGAKALTYVEPTGTTRAERWARQDQKKTESSSMDSFVLGATTGIAVGPRSMLGSALLHGQSPASGNTDFESGSDNGAETGSSSDSSSGSSD